MLISEIGEGETKCLSIPQYREICISSVKHSHVKYGKESEGTVVLLTEKRASHIHPEQKGTSQAWVVLKRNKIPQIFTCTCVPSLTPLSNTTIRNYIRSKI